MHYFSKCQQDIQMSLIICKSYVDIQIPHTNRTSKVWMFDQQSIIYQLWINRFINCEFGSNKKQLCEVFKDVKNRRRNSLYLVGCHYHHINVNQWIYHYSNIEVWKNLHFLDLQIWLMKLFYVSAIILKQMFYFI